MEFRQVLPNRTEPTTRSNEHKIGHNALTFTKPRADGRQKGGRGVGSNEIESSRRGRGSKDGAHAVDTFT